MKILFFIDSLGSGGRERRFIELLKTVHKNENIKFEVVILSSKIFYQELENLNVPIHFIKRKTKKDFSVFFKLYKICLDFRPEIIHSWHFMCSIYAIPISKILQISLLSDVIADSPENIRFPKSLWLKSKIVTFFSKRINANSQAGLQAYKIPSQKSNYIYNGFDFSRLSELLPDQQIRSKFDITTPFIVGMVGRFHKHKDYPTFISSAIQILEKRNDITFLMVGDGPLKSEIQNLVPSRFSKNILFLGEQKNIESIVNTFNIGVLSTFTEGISNVIMEYMAMGKPVIATGTGGTKELVIDNQTGYLIETNNIQEMTNKILFFLNNTNNAKMMGENGKKRIMSDFNIDRVQQSYLNLYEKLMN